MIIHKQLKDFFQIPNSELSITAKVNPSPGKEFTFGYDISQADRDAILAALQGCVGCNSSSVITSADNALLSDIANIA